MKEVGISVAPPNVTHLTTRILHDANVEYAWGSAPTYELSGWIRDELLVSEEASPDERNLLGKFGWRRKSSVLSPSSKVKLQKRAHGVKDIEIWTPKDPSQFAMVETVIADLTYLLGRTPLVSPNHLMVACNHGCYCPAYAPTALATQPRRAARMAKFEGGQAPVRVVVIDTGYIKKAPLESRRSLGGFADRPGEIFNGNAWVTSPPDDAYVLPGGRLELLDGHGTFTAGEIAERCPRVHVTVVGIRDVESAATEASVAREIYRNADADVIVPVFAFHSLHGLRNWTFTNVLPQLEKTSVVVCPAGNESSYKPHYPAGLPWPDYPVVGVGSFVPGPGGSANLSAFSNFGDWVFGYTAGESVPGLYFNRTTKVEDGPDKKVAYKGWARWSGTSFAAPKVAAYLANAAVSGVSARDAAATLKLTAPQVPLFAATAAGGGLGLDLRSFAK